VQESGSVVPPALTGEFNAWSRQWTGGLLSEVPPGPAQLLFSRAKIRNKLKDLEKIDLVLSTLPGFDRARHQQADCGNHASHASPLGPWLHL